MAALVTDTMRAEYISRGGYDTQILEFIDMEHTLKNILIRAIYTEIKENTETIRACEEMLTSIQCWGDYWISRMKREKKEYSSSRLRKGTIITMFKKDSNKDRGIWLLYLFCSYRIPVM